MSFEVFFLVLGNFYAICGTIRAASSLSPQIVSAANGTCNSYSNVTLVSCRSPCTVELGDVASLFVKNAGQALAVKTCPHREEAFKKVNNGQ